MSVLVNKNTRVIVQGITGREAAFHARNMMENGTQIVAGVTPGKGGIWVLDEKVPVFDTMRSAVEATEADTTILFVPAHQATDALYEAADSGVELVICVTDGIPVRDISRVCAYMQTKGVRLLGPNSCGVITPGVAKVGMYPDGCCMPGKVGIISRSATLSYIIMDRMKLSGIGVSTCVGIGGDILCGTSMQEALEMFEFDPHTERVLIVGEIGGTMEVEAARYAAYQMSKPVCAYIAGEYIPEGKLLTHAGTYVEGGIGSARSKAEAIHNLGIPVTMDRLQIVDMLSH